MRHAATSCGCSCRPAVRPLGSWPSNCRGPPASPHQFTLGAICKRWFAHVARARRLQSMPRPLEVLRKVGSWGEGHRMAFARWPEGHVWVKSPYNLKVVEYYVVYSIATTHVLY
eukprot:4954547-Prymnesium_polylepis.1